jgi:hypothetical protein
LQQDARELILLVVGQAGDGRNGFFEQACLGWNMAGLRRAEAPSSPAAGILNFRFAALPSPHETSG